MENAQNRHKVESALAREKLKNIRLDAEFNAFVADRFPSVLTSLFTNNMNRLEKENVLLLASSPAEVIQELEDWLNGRDAASPVPATNDKSGSISKRRSNAGSSGEGNQIGQIFERLTELNARKARVLAKDPIADVIAIDDAIMALNQQLRQWHNIKIGSRLCSGRYLLIRQIGQGGFATIWQGYDHKTGKSVAIKILHKQWTDNSIYAERFSRGAQFMHDIAHPAIARVLETVMCEDGIYYFVMEYYSCGDLETAILAGEVKTHEALVMLIDAAKALQFTHEKRILHRDIKPSNILLDDAGHTLLTDFDLVWAPNVTGGTKTGALGSFIFAAPEEMSDASRVGVQSDIYSFAMTTVFSIYGRKLPLDALTNKRLFIRKLNCNKKLKSVLLKALENDPGQRYQSMSAYLAAYTEALDSASLRVGVDRGSLPLLYGAVAAGLGAVALLASSFGIYSKIGQRPPLQPGGYRATSVLPEETYRPAMVPIAPGSFKMGSAISAPDRFVDEEIHNVVLTHGFWIGQTEVTQLQYKSIMDQSPSHFVGNDLPVEQVTWSDAIRYCNKISERENLPPCYRDNEGGMVWLNLYNCPGYRLPTEAEWEYAARAGENTVYAGGNDIDLVAWHETNSEQKTHPVRSKKPNSWGLFDMSGNVWELVWDGYQERLGNSVDPIGSDAAERVDRGGGYDFRARHHRVSNRNWILLSTRSSSLGFRPVRTLPVK